jgi:hypothetical protein
MDTQAPAVLPPLSPINVSASLRDRAYAALRQMITEADIYAHADEIRLDEKQLSQQLGVSRTPIREAITLLEQEGFLRTEPRRGIFIVRKTKKQIIEMIEMWAALESMAARLATLNAERRGDRGTAAHLRRVPHRRRRPSTSRNTRTATSRSTRRSSGLSGSHLMGKTDRGPVRAHARDPAHDDLAERTARRARIIDHMSIIEALGEARQPSRPSASCASTSLDLAAHVEKYCDFLEMSNAFRAGRTQVRLSRRGGPSGLT